MIVPRIYFLSNFLHSYLRFACDLPSNDVTMIENDATNPLLQLWKQQWLYPIPCVILRVFSDISVNKVVRKGGELP